MRKGLKNFGDAEDPAPWERGVAEPLETRYFPRIIRRCRSSRFGVRRDSPKIGGRWASAPLAWDVGVFDP